MTGYQEVVTDPSYADQIVCFTATMVGNYGVATKHTESGHAHARAVVMREARGPAWTDWLHDRGVVALSGIDTRSLVLHLRQAGSMRAIAMAGEASLDGGADERRGPSPQMAGRALAAKVSTREPVRVLGHGPRADRGRRLRLQALDPEPARLVGSRGHGLSARRGRRRARPLRRRAALERPRRSERPRGRDSDSLALGRTCPDSRDLPRAPAPCARDRARDIQASVRPSRRESPRRRARRPAGCSSPPRTTASRLRRARRARRRTSRSTTRPSRGFEYPELRARSVQFHPEAGPGPHDAWGLIDGWIEEVSTLAKAA